MILVIDTNLWIKELALNSGLGSAVRFFVKQGGARIALPEVVRLEVEHKLRELLGQNISQIHDSTRRLLAIFGQMREVVLPSPSDIEHRVATVFSSLGIECLEMPFSLESARASFLKTIRDKTQQFKDGVLWADCANLLSTDHVLLATLDKAFYRDRDYAKGLAPNLAAEIEIKEHKLRIVPSIEKVLSQIRSAVDIDDSWFVDAVRRQAHPSVPISLPALVLWRRRFT